MLKLSCHVSKKLPVPGREFSSQSFACGIEAELADAADAPALKAKAEELFNLVQRAVDEQIAAAGLAATAPSAAQPPAQHAGNGNGRASKAARGNGREVMATAAQARAIRSIAAEQTLDLAEVLAPYKVADVEGLSIRAASGLIDSLKARKGNGARR